MKATLSMLACSVKIQTDRVGSIAWITELFISQLTAKCQVDISTQWKGEIC
jgi:hypothetical protein